MWHENTIHITRPDRIPVKWHWSLFYERKKVKWYYPFIGLIFPAGYLLFIVIHAAILNFDTSITSLNGYSPLIYPYFFVDFEQIGVTGVSIYSAIISGILIVLGFIFYGIDKIKIIGKSKN